MSENNMKVEIGQWVVLKDGKVVKITTDNIENIERYATKEEILQNGGCPVDLEYRMYFFVPYNISPIQQGIQAGHALGEYVLKYGKFNPTHIVWDFLQYWKTWIILNGGTTNANRDFTMISAGSLNQIADDLVENEIEMSYFLEPDLNDALSAVAVICDERVFNKKDYPEFVDWLFDVKMYKAAADATPPENKALLRRMELETLELSFPKYFAEWKEKVIGGDKNLFLRELIRDMKLA